MSAEAGPATPRPISASAAARTSWEVFIFHVLEQSDVPLTAACESRHAPGKACDGDPALLTPVRRWFEEDDRVDGRKGRRSGGRRERQRQPAPSRRARALLRPTAWGMKRRPSTAPSADRSRNP